MIIALGVSEIAIAARPTRAMERDCSDFRSQAEAQRYFIERGGPRRDPDRLDAKWGRGRLCFAAVPLQPARRAETSPQPARAGPDDPCVRHEGRRRRHHRRALARAHARRRYRVRMLGIDSPQVFGRVECGGRRASARLRRLASGRRARLRTDPARHLRPPRPPAGLSWTRGDLLGRSLTVHFSRPPDAPTVRPRGRGP
jgi:hypothetical protein